MLLFILCIRVPFLVSLSNVVYWAFSVPTSKSFLDMLVILSINTSPQTAPLTPSQSLSLLLVSWCTIISAAVKVNYFSTVASTLLWDRGFITFAWKSIYIISKDFSSKITIVSSSEMQIHASFSHCSVVLNCGFTKSLGHKCYTN